MSATPYIAETNGRPAASTEPGLGLQGSVEVFSACPVSVGVSGSSYLSTVWNVARWSERHGCRGILVHVDNRLVDSWLVAQVILQSTRRLSSLVAVQPAYMHPYTVAKMVATLTTLYGRKLFINWVADGFSNDLEALADATPHDERYERLMEYALIVRGLTDGETLSFAGEYYEVRSLKLRPEVPVDRRPEFVVSGSSQAGTAAAQTLEARSVTYAMPPRDDSVLHRRPAVGSGLRVGIIARAEADDAWRTAFSRFPPDRKGALMRHHGRKVWDSHGYEGLCRLAEARAAEGNPYWMVPFENYKAMCPYLVGSHDEVAAVVSRYMSAGYGTFILDEPETEADLASAHVVFERAKRAVVGAV